MFRLLAFGLANLALVGSFGFVQYKSWDQDGLRGLLATRMGLVQGTVSRGSTGGRSVSRSTGRRSSSHK